MQDTKGPGAPREDENTCPDSDAPTQLLSRPPHRATPPAIRAAKRRQRLEALITQGGVDPHPEPADLEITDDERPPRTATLSTDVAPIVGSFTRPLSGIRLTGYVALGVTLGGVAALRINEALLEPEPMSPTLSAHAINATADVYPAANPIAATLPVSPSEPHATTVLTPALEQPRSAFVALSAPARPAMKSPQAIRPALAPSGVSTLPNAAETNGSTCSLVDELHIPTRLHPRVNPLMTSKQVFSER